MSGTVLLILSLAITAEVAGTIALKISHGFTRAVPVLVTAVCYGTAFFAMSLVMRSVPVGIVYAIWSGVGIVLISMVGWTWFGERLDPAALAGIGLIVAGVLVINLLSGTAER